MVKFNSITEFHEAMRDVLSDKIRVSYSEHDFDIAVKALYPLLGCAKTTSEIFNELLDGIFDGRIDDAEARAVSAIIPYVVDKEKLLNREDNVMNAGDSSDWRNGMNLALGRYIAEKGHPADFSDSPYGDGVIYDFDENPRPHGDIVGIFNVKEDSWKIFEGTFAGVSDTIGLKADFVYEDGHMTTKRLDKSFSEVLRKIS